MSSPTPDGAPPRAGWPRLAATAAIVILLGLQLAGPLHYYAGGRDPSDERFAWRMFSARRAWQCQAVAVERLETGAARQVRLGRALHPAWAGALRLGRTPVVDAFLTDRCDAPEVVSVELKRKCVRADGEQVPLVVHARACAPWADRLAEASR